MAGTGLGTRNIEYLGRQVRASAAANNEYMKPGGVTLDWSTVDPVSGSEKTLTDDRRVPVGASYLRYGTVLAKISASGKYGPYDSTALDGRQTLVRGECFILDETILDSDPHSDYPNRVFDGGLVWLDRVVNNADDLTLNPTRTQIETAFPNITWADS